MHVIHICGDSAVGKNYLLKNIRKIEKNQTATLSDSEEKLLERFEIQKPFKVLNPVSNYEKWETPNIDSLENNVKELMESGELNTLVEHWQHKSHSIFEFIHNFNPAIIQKAFQIWKNPDLHLHHLKTHRPNSDYTKRVSEDPNLLKKNFKSIYSKLSANMMKEIGLDVEVVVHITGFQYCTIMPYELQQLIE